MHTRVKSLVIQILEFIETLSETKDHPNLFVRIESQLALAQLKNVLVTTTEPVMDIEKSFKGSANEALRCIFQPLVIFLCERWDNIQGTDAIYPHSPYSRINRICFIMAESLAKIYGIHPYYLLMPTIKSVLAAFDEKTREHFLSLAIHRFIFADDSHKPIDVFACLSQAERNKTTTLVHANDDARELNANESYRITKHSNAAFNYYDAIQFAAKRDFDISNTWQKKEFEEAIIKDSYPVTASYGEAGNKRLAKYIMSHIDSQAQLIDLMTRFMHKQDWKEFIGAISAEKLAQVVLGHDSWVDVLQNQKSYTGDADHDKAMLFCLSEIYWRQRQEEEKSKKHTQSANANRGTASWLGGYGARISNFGKTWIAPYAKKIEERGKEYLGGYTLEEKGMGVEIFQAFLVSDAELNELHAFLQADPKREKYKGALFQGLLGMVASQTEAIVSLFSRKKSMA